MFGYVRIAKPELRVREYEMYKAVYCSLCRDLGRRYGIISRFTLSYDFTFLALLNMALKPGCDGIERKRCAFNPFKKCNYCKNSSALQMPSAAAMIMLYYKLKDNLKDEKGFKRLGVACLFPFFVLPHKKAAKSFPEIEKIVSCYITEQSEIEAENSASVDRAADPTAKALSQILMLCSEDSTEKRILERLGYCIGRYIYILDAACDLEEDIKFKSYNVFKNGLQGEAKQCIKERALPQIYFCINEAAKAFELLPIKKYKEILGNIIYLGLEDISKKELNI
ncbi:MAG: hypothetical protein IKD04_02380 [Clostridia bacterium]|nr:hypothetical protein [Clostridia bacterium]